MRAQRDTVVLGWVMLWANTLARERFMPSSLLKIIKQSLEAVMERFDQSPSAYELGEDLFGADKSPGKAVAADYKKLLREKLRAEHPG